MELGVDIPTLYRHCKKDNDKAIATLYRHCKKDNDKAIATLYRHCERSEAIRTPKRIDC